MTTMHGITTPAAKDPVTFAANVTLKFVAMPNMTSNLSVSDPDPDNTSTHFFGYVGIVVFVAALGACMTVVAVCSSHFRPSTRRAKVCPHAPVADSLTHNVGRLAVGVPLGMPQPPHPVLPNSEIQNGRIWLGTPTGDAYHEPLPPSVSMHWVCGIPVPLDGGGESIVHVRERASATLDGTGNANSGARASFHFSEFPALCCSGDTGLDLDDASSFASTGVPLREGPSFYRAEQGKCFCFTGDSLEGEPSCASTEVPSFRFREGASFCMGDAAGLDGSDLFREGSIFCVNGNACVDDAEVGSSSALRGSARSLLREGTSFCL